MADYKHVLLVTDLREDSDQLFEKSKLMMRLGEKIKLSILHVVQESILTAGYEIVPIVPASDESELVQQARGKIDALLTRFAITTDAVYIETALSMRRGILDYVESNAPDLLIIGRHTRHGLAALLGATADDVLPAVNCDVLVVKLGAPV